MSIGTTDFTTGKDGSTLAITAGITTTNVTLAGTYTPAGSAAITFSLASTALPASDAAQSKYVSAQINNAGAVTLYNNLGSNPVLQAGQLVEVWRTVIPANATNDELSGESTDDLQ